MDSDDDAASYDDAVNARVDAISKTHPEFAKSYPVLLRMCCGANTEELKSRAMSMLDLMLQQLQLAKKSGGTEEELHRASVAVGKALGDIYLPKPI